MSAPEGGLRGPLERIAAIRPDADPALLLHAVNVARAALGMPLAATPSPPAPSGVEGLARLWRKLADEMQPARIDGTAAHRQDAMALTYRECANAVLSTLASALAALAVEPVAWEFQHEETGLVVTVSNDGINNPENFAANNRRHHYVGALYRTPAAAPSEPEVSDPSVVEVLQQIVAATQKLEHGSCDDCYTAACIANGALARAGEQVSPIVRNPAYITREPYNRARCTCCPGSDVCAASQRGDE